MKNIEDNQNNSTKDRRYLSSLLFFMHVVANIAILLLSVSAKMLFYINLWFFFGYILYKSNNKGLAYFWSFGIPFLGVFILFITCMSGSMGHM